MPASKLSSVSSVPSVPSVSAGSPRRRRLMRSAAALIAVAAVVAACSPMPPRTTTVASVDIGRYAGRWYEVASVKQFFSIGLVNTTADYSLLANGIVQVVNSGRYFTPDGPPTSILGTAVPVDSSNARLNVSFTGDLRNDVAGNYWIVDLDPDYQWAIVSDPTGLSCFLLSRTRTISSELRADLEARAVAAGVDISNLTDTPQL